MNSQSAHTPVIEAKKSAKGPVWFFMKPCAGVPPLIHARSEVVAKPRPKTLSRNAHMKVQPMTIRPTASSLRSIGDLTMSSW